jgi:hypothetical protein
MQVMLDTYEVGIPSAGMVGKQGVAAPVSSRLVCQPCFMCQLLHHCVNASLLLYKISNCVNASLLLY